MSKNLSMGMDVSVGVRVVEIEDESCIDAGRSAGAAPTGAESPSRRGNGGRETPSRRNW